MSSAKAIKPFLAAKSRKSGTTSEKHHRFEPFTHRIAKLHIDPIRRVRRHDLDDETASTTASYFKSALEEWDDLNTSETFANFVRAVSPICESLPQLVHFENRIAELLQQCLDKRDSLSLEPLLALVAHFAHDLGVRFEKHFPSFVRLIANIAAKHPDVEVIEWSFTCLTWMFKYLSRFLVTDLRPTYDLLAPLLGRQQQKSFITRFAAEAMSFLVKKASILYRKDHGPLDKLLHHAFIDLQNHAGTKVEGLYQHGLMTLFSEAIKGINRGLHSSADATFECITTVAMKTDTNSSTLAEDVVCGVLVNVMHHTEAATLLPVVETITKLIHQESATATQIRLLARLLFLVAGVRKGSRVSDWDSVLQSATKLLTSAKLEYPRGTTLTKQVFSAAAVILQTSPMDMVIPRHRHIMDLIATNDLQFLSFIHYFAQLGHDRFRSFVLRYFQRFIVHQWNSSEAELCVLIASLSESGCLRGSDDRLTCPSSWQKHITDQFELLAVQMDKEETAVHDHPQRHLLYTCQIYLEVLGSLICDPSNKSRVAQSLRKLLSVALGPDSQIGQDYVKFATGQGFASFVEGLAKDDGFDPSLWSSLCTSGARFASMSTYLEGVLAYMEKFPSHTQSIHDDFEPLKLALVRNLSCPSHSVRRPSLCILQRLYRIEHENDSETLALALLIEDTALNLQTARTLSMHIRKLAANYTSSVSDQSLKQIVPRFCFGLLSVKLSQVWDDASAALRDIASSNEGEDDVARLAFSWLEIPPERDLTVRRQVVTEQQKAQLTAFECSNILALEHQRASSEELLKETESNLQEHFTNHHQSSPAQPSLARSQALRVLNGIPHVAERRSRLFVPMFLEQGSPDEDQEALDTNDTLGTQTNWSRSDQKALLSVFAKFTNPKVLYKSSEVYEALLESLSNGDIDIQKPSLDAVLAWKSSAVLPYAENLHNLLDDARFNEEVAGFLQSSEGANAIQSQHRNELMPVLLRLLYGRIIARKGTADGKSGMSARRKMVLKALAGYPHSELGLFIHIALGPLIGMIFDQIGAQQHRALLRKAMSLRRQVGLLKMIENLLTELGSRLLPFTAELIEPVLHCLVNASRALTAADPADGIEAIEPMESSHLRNIRQSGYRCLILLFEKCEEFDYKYYIPTITEQLVRPRLEKLPVETAQAPSGILQLLSTWSSSQNTVLYFADLGHTALGKVGDCLVVPSVKNEVKLFTLAVVNNLLDMLSQGSDVLESIQERLKVELLQPNVDGLLVRLGQVLTDGPGRDVLEATVNTVRRLAQYVTSSSEASNMIKISLFLLNQPLRQVKPRTKGDLLGVLQHLLPLHQAEMEPSFKDQIFQMVSSLFGFFKDRQSRQLLCQVLFVFAQHEVDLAEVAGLCSALNSFSTHRVDEPDFEQRLKAFNLINEVLYRRLDARGWAPILYNMLFYIKDNEELAIRTNASFTLRRFVQCASQASNASDEAFNRLFTESLLPAIRASAREPSEFIRAEYMNVMAHAIEHCPSHPELGDMSVLLVGGDEEASFFTNVLHVQQHRRLRALRRLAAEVQLGHISSGNISRLFVPLIEHFIANRGDDGGAQNLAAETVTTIGLLVEWIEWSQFKALLKRFIGDFQSQSEPEKVTIRLLGVTADALTRAATAKYEHVKSDMVMTEPLPEVQHGIDVTTGNAAIRSRLALTMPRQEKLGEDIAARFLPVLTDFLHSKDESFVSLRIPVAVTIVKLLKLLPFHELTNRLPPVLTDIAHILRSRSQDSRDLTRRTLAEISTLLGPECFGFVLKELRGALARGYQLHVLSFTVHSILVANATLFKPGDLDYCLPQIVAVIMDDIFGVTGQEKDAEEYISKMKEVKSSKSYDSMELLAKMTTLQRLSDLVRPVQALLQEKLNDKLVKKIDELLRRLGVGILRNDAVQSRTLLIFCYELIQSVRGPKASPSLKNIKETAHAKRYLVNLKGASKGGSRGSTTVYDYKIVRFALDVLRSVLQRYDDLKTPQNLSGFVPIIKDGLVQAHEEIQISSLRLLTTIIKVPLSDIDRDTDVYIAQAVKSIKASPSTSTELAQASLKLISAILRERRHAQLDESKLKSRLAILLDRLKPDLEEPDRQGITFTFLKAVMSRKVMVPEMYDVMDTVSSIMVTNQTRGARDLARGAYFQFLMEYPQGEKRFSKQLAFLVKNLEYQYPEGRQSVLEAIHLIISKIGQGMVQEVTKTFFVPLAMVLINDDSQDCREMAALLLREMFDRADAATSRSFLTLLKSWMELEKHHLLKRVALQCYGIYFEVRGTKGEKEVPALQKQIRSVLSSETGDGALDGWELIYVSLQTLAKLCHLFPDAVLSADSKGLWSAVEQNLGFPHAWVRSTAAKLVGLYFADFARTNAADGFHSLPLTGSNGLTMDSQEMLQVTWRSIGILRAPGVGEELATQNVRNLVFLGRTLEANKTTWKPMNREDADDLSEGEDGDRDHQMNGYGDSKTESKSAVQYIFERVSAILRREPATTRAPSLVPKTASLQLLGALCGHLSADTLTPLLSTVLLPLHNLTDDNIPAPYSPDEAFNVAYKGLQTTSHEIMSLLQKKIGTSKYIARFAEVQQGVRERREGRRVKRRIGAVMEPARAAREKRRKGEKKKVKRKERSAEERGKRRGW